MKTARLRVRPHMAGFMHSANRDCCTPPADGREFLKSKYDVEENHKTCLHI